MSYRFIPRIRALLKMNPISKSDVTKLSDLVTPDSFEAKLPELLPEEFEIYNCMSSRMDDFHEYFRRTWKGMYSVCESGSLPANMTVRNLQRTGLDFCRHLSAHHQLEEQLMFPMLAKRMAAFKDELQMPLQHQQIHDGLDKFQEYLYDCGKGWKELELSQMKELMDNFGTVLWEHLDEEVRELGAENMRKYWTLEDMERMRF